MWLQHRDEHRRRGCGCSRQLCAYLTQAQSRDEYLVIAAQRMIERTLKARGILLRSALQVAIVSLSFFGWKIRDTALRLPCLTTFRWISATVLGSRQEHVNWTSKAFATGVTHGVSCSFASNTELLRSLNPPLQPLSRAIQTSAQSSPIQSKFDRIYLVDRRVLDAFQLAIGQYKPKGNLL